MCISSPVSSPSAAGRASLTGTHAAEPPARAPCFLPSRESALEKETYCLGASSLMTLFKQDDACLNINTTVTLKKVTGTRFKNDQELNTMLHLQHTVHLCLLIIHHFIILNTRAQLNHYFSQIKGKLSIWQQTQSP